MPETLGSLVGRVPLTFFMINSLRPYEIVSLISLFILLMSILLSSPKKGIKELLTSSLSPLLFFKHPVPYYPVIFPGLIIFWSGSGGMPMGTIWTCPSPSISYQNIVLALQNDQYSLFGNGEYIGSFPDPYQAAGFVHFTFFETPLLARFY